MRFTADMAREGNNGELDARIKDAVRNPCGYNRASIRIYHDDSFRWSIESDLIDRGFKNIEVPDITIKGDVYFEWDA